MVAVLIGPEKHRFEVHKSLLCEASDFFRAALTGNFRERNGEIELPEQKSEVFKFFIHSLYAGSLRGFYRSRDTKPSSEELRSAVLRELEASNNASLQELSLDNQHGRAFNMANYRDAPFLPLISLYILAGVLQVHKIKDQIATLIIDVYGFDGKDQDFTNEHQSIEKDGEADDYVFDDFEDSVGETTTLFWSLRRVSQFEDPSIGINKAWTRSHLAPLSADCWYDAFAITLCSSKSVQTKHI